MASVPVLPEKVDYYVQSLRKHRVDEIGGTGWLDAHETLIKLNQQAILEVTSFREEQVKEIIILHNKVEVLVHEAICVFVWRQHVLKQLLQLDHKHQATFILYTVLYHEATAVSLLETLLYHPNGVQALGDTCLDLVDYALQAVIHLIGLVNYSRTGESSTQRGQNDLERMQQDLAYKIGMRCLSILNYIVDQLPNVSVSVARRLVCFHDTPCVLSEILHCQPWLRHTTNGNEKFIDGQWRPVRGDDFLKVCKSEAQTWFCMRQLLMNQTAIATYEMNTFRRTEIGKCEQLLNNRLLDQLPPLAEFKQFLCYLITSGHKIDQKQSFILEEVPEIIDGLLKDAKKNGGFERIAKEQAKLLIYIVHEDIVHIAKRLNSAYNTDLLAELEPKIDQTIFCDFCNQHQATLKRCGRCLSAVYCSEQCQSSHWQQHKPQCVPQITK